MAFRSSPVTRFLWHRVSVPRKQGHCPGRPNSRAPARGTQAEATPSSLCQVSAAPPHLSSVHHAQARCRHPSNSDPEALRSVCSSSNGCLYGFYLHSLSPFSMFFIPCVDPHVHLVLRPEDLPLPNLLAQASWQWMLSPFNCLSLSCTFTLGR